MITQERLIEEMRPLPDDVLRGLWHYLNFIERQREEEQ